MEQSNNLQNAENHTVTRLSNIDILRFLASVCVIIEHFCEAGGQGGITYADESGIIAESIIVRIIYSLARVAVPVFILLSGYCSIGSKKANLGKVIEIWLMLICFSITIYMGAVFAGETAFTLKSFISKLLPGNYYIFLYLTLYILSPFINTTVDYLNRKQYTVLILLLSFMFILWSTVINTLTSVTGAELIGVYATGRTTTDMGFNICLFVTCYLIGGYLKKYPVKIKKVFLIGGILLSAVFCALTKLYLPVFSKAFLYYDSIFVVFQAVLTVIWFTGMTAGPNNIVSYLAKNTLGIYLIHNTILPIFAKKIIHIDNMIKLGVGRMLLALLLTVGGTYVCSLVCSSVWRGVTEPIWKYFRRTKLWGIRFLPKD